MSLETVGLESSAYRMIARRLFGILGIWGTLSAAVLFHPASIAGAPGTASQVAAPPRTEHLVLGMVRNDGILLPFAAFNGRKWSTPWPSIDRRLGQAPALPVNLTSVPRDWWGGEEPGPWRLWTRNAETSRALTLSSPVMMFVGLSRQLGFRTDQPPVLPPVPPSELPFPKIGLAISGDAALGPIATVSTLAPAWASFSAQLRPDIDAAEERTLKQIRATDFWNHPFKREERAAIVPQFEAWYVTPLGDGTERMSYIEAVKKYPVRPQDEECGLETFVSGWVHHDESRAKPKSGLKAVVTYCDRRGVSYMLPFGQLRVNGRVHWIVQMSGRDHEWYAVVEGTPGRARYVAEYQAGWASLDR